MAEKSVGHANSFVGECKVRVKFDSPLIQGERCLRVAGQEQLSSLSAGLERFQRGAGRFFQGLIETGQRFGRLPKPSPKAHGCRSQLMDYLITSINVPRLLSQGRS